MVIGITGTIGAGKGTVVDYLVQKGFTHYSVRDFLLEELTERGLAPNRDNMRTVANDLREKYGPSCVIEMLYQKAIRAGGKALIESVRAIGEAKFLQDNGALLLSVDAEQNLRYERVSERGHSTDDVDFETFVRHEALELSSTEASGQNLLQVMLMSDFQILNNGTVEELHSAVEQFLQKIPSQES